MRPPDRNRIARVNWMSVAIVQASGIHASACTEGLRPMASTIASMVLTISMATTGGLFHRHTPGGRILPPGPGPGWGFPNGQPDGYGYVDYGTYLPLGADRTAEYHFPRNFALPTLQLIPQTYWNPYVTNGQRYIPYVNCGGDHPAGRAPVGSAMLPVHPYDNIVGSRPVVTPPRFSGRVEGTPVPSGGSGLIP